MQGYRIHELIAAWLCVALLASSASAVEDGVYESDQTGALCKPVTLTVTRGRIHSLSNANDRWSAIVCFPQVGFQEGNRYSVVLGGRATKITSWGNSSDKEYVFSLEFMSSELEAAKALFGLPVEARQHPAYAIDGSFTTDKGIYLVGEKIVVTMVIRNVGDQPFRFFKGGHQRGPRDDQFHFSGVGPDGGTLMVKSAMNFGGMGSVITIAPHDQVSLSVDLDGWIDASQPGYYTLMVSYLLPIHATDDVSKSETWEDYLTRPCTFEVQGTAEK